MLPDNEILSRLMKQAAGGNETAFSDIVKYFEKPVYNMAMQSVRNREDALDISQEVFIKLWRTAGSYRGDCSVSSWIMLIAKNTMLDLLRRRLSHQTDSLTADNDDGDTANVDIPDESPDSNPALSYERRERISEIRRAIALLENEHREIILLRDIEGMSYAEISEILGLEEGTVKSRLFRARNCLKEILQKRNIF